MTIQLIPASLEQADILHSFLVENKICYHKSKFKQEILKGLVYAIQDNQTIIGTVTIYPNKPDSFPLGIGNATSAWYIQNFVYDKESLFFSTIFSSIENFVKEKGIIHLFIQSNKFYELESVGFVKILPANIQVMTKTLC